MSDAARPVPRRQAGAFAVAGRDRDGHFFTKQGTGRLLAITTGGSGGKYRMSNHFSWLPSIFVSTPCFKNGEQMRWYRSASKSVTNQGLILSLIRSVACA